MIIAWLFSANLQILTNQLLTLSACIIELEKYLANAECWLRVCIVIILSRLIAYNLMSMNLDAN